MHNIYLSARSELRVLLVVALMLGIEIKQKGRYSP